MKVFLKLLGVFFIVIGCSVNGLGILASLQSPYGIGGVVGGVIFIVLGMSILIMNRKGYSW